MITVDQLEVLLRTVPSYFLFGALSLYLFSWIDKKPKYSMIAEITLTIIGITAFIVLLSGMIPSPLTDGLNTEHVKMVIKLLTLLSFVGLLSIINLIIRATLKKGWKPLIFVTFALALFLFFSATRISKIKFELNIPATTEETNSK